MNKPRKFRRTQERVFSAHHMLLETAQRANDLAQSKRAGWMYDAVTAITFSALAIESLCNTIGEHMIVDWQDFQNSSPVGKTRLIAERLNVPYDKANAPWQTTVWLFRFRNLVAHAKPEPIVEEKMLTSDEVASKQFDAPESKLEKQITLANSKRAVEAAVAIKELFVRKLPAEDPFGISTDGWSGITVPHNDA